MSSAAATVRYSSFIVLCLLAVSCHSADQPTLPVVDLTRTFAGTDHRPAQGFEVTAYEADGIARPSIVMPVPARAIWMMPLPRHGLFRAFVTTASVTPGDTSGKPGASVRFRLGISDDRVFEDLTECTL